LINDCLSLIDALLHNQISNTRQPRSAVVVCSQADGKARFGLVRQVDRRAARLNQEAGEGQIEWTFRIPTDGIENMRRPRCGRPEQTAGELNRLRANLRRRRDVARRRGALRLLNTAHCHRRRLNAQPGDTWRLHGGLTRSRSFSSGIFALHFLSSVRGMRFPAAGLLALNLRLTKPRNAGQGLRTRYERKGNARGQRPPPGPSKKFDLCASALHRRLLSE
jgi:hypothetical protein